MMRSSYDLRNNVKWKNFKTAIECKKFNFKDT